MADGYTKGWSSSKNSKDKYTLCCVWFDTLISCLQIIRLCSTSKSSLGP